MKSKNRIMIILICFIILTVVILWASGIIPKQIAKISSTVYLKENFPKKELEYVNIEWASSFGDYIITFRDEDNELHSFCIGPKYFPVNLGQGMFEFEEKYEEIINANQEAKEKMEAIKNLEEKEKFQEELDKIEKELKGLSKGIE